MFRRTDPAYRMISTHGGQRRLLKTPIDPAEHIRRAVETGIYRTSDEINAMMRDRELQRDSVKQVMRRFRQDIVRGASIHDYPTEYMIVRHNPPPPFQPRVPIRQLKQMANEARLEAKKEGKSYYEAQAMKNGNPIQALVQTYLNRYEQKQRKQGNTVKSERHTFPDGSPLTSEEYYRRLLGIPKQKRESSSLETKSALLQKAYVSAAKHYELMRTSETGMTDAEAMKQVDELLEQASRDEYMNAADVVARTQELRRKQPKRKEESSTTPSSSSSAAAAPVDGKDEQPDHSISSTSDSIGPKTTLLDLAKDHEGTRNESWRRLLRGGRKVHPDEPVDERGDPLYWGGGRGWESFSRSYTAMNRRTPPQGNSCGSSFLQRNLQQEQTMDKNKTGLETVFTNVLGSEPRVLEGMMRWSQRLQGVPYIQWTVGAATALDHWIARQVLQYSEETWQSLLEGTDPNYLDRGRLIIQARESLFPETIIPGEEVGEEREEDREEDGNLDNPLNQTEFEERSLNTQKLPSIKPSGSSLDELLVSLGELTVRNDGSSNSRFGRTTELNREKTTATLAELDERVSGVINDLQDWRKLHAEKPYPEWSTSKKSEFDTWIRNDFIPTCGGDSVAKGGSIDYDATRLALLSGPPVSQEESNEFWSALSNERDAVELLDQMRRDGPPKHASFLQASFWTDLTYEEQLQQLLNIGAIRPLLDEYTRESDRRAFLQKYTDVLLTGVPMECLIPDPDGPITLDDLQSQQQQGQGGGGGVMDSPLIRDLMEQSRRGGGDPPRFRLEVIPYRGSTPSRGSDSSDDDSDATRRATDDEGKDGDDPTTTDLELSRALYKAWNEHKVNRAQYEERLFQTNRLGLEYDKPPKEASIKEYFDDGGTGVKKKEDEDDVDAGKKKKKKEEISSFRRIQSSISKQQQEKEREYRARMEKRFPPPPGRKI